MPDLLDRIEIQPKGLGDGVLGEPGVDPDTELAERELEDCEAARGIEMGMGVGGRDAAVRGPAGVTEADAGLGKARDLTGDAADLLFDQNLPVAANGDTP